MKRALCRDVGLVVTTGRATVVAQRRVESEASYATRQTGCASLRLQQANRRHNSKILLIVSNGGNGSGVGGRIAADGGRTGY